MWFPLIGLVGKKEADEDSFEEIDEEFAEVDEEFSEVDEEFSEVDEIPADPEDLEVPPPGPPSKAGDKGTGDFKLVMSSPDMDSQAPMERLDGVERAIDEAIRRMDMTDRSSESVSHDLGTVKESIGRIEANMRELTSLYDLISSQVNPFIDVDQGELGEGEEGVGESPSFDTLFEPTPELTTEGGIAQLSDDELPSVGEPGVPPSHIYSQPGMIPGEPMVGMPHPGVAVERPLRVARLTQIGSDSTCLIALVRWIEFLLSRVRRNQIKSVLSFYVRIGWISEGVRNHMIDVIRGIRSSPTGAKATTTTIETPKDKEGDVVMSYGKERVHEMKAMDPKRPKVDDWRLTIEDHLKSLILIERVRGTEVNKDRLEDLERDIENLRKGLDGFFGL